MTDNQIEYAAVEEEIIAMEEQGQTVVIAVIDNQLVGIIGISDTIKDTSATAVAEMKRMGIEVVMITGDNQRAAAVTAQKSRYRAFYCRSAAFNKVRRDFPPEKSRTGGNDW